MSRRVAGYRRRIFLFLFYPPCSDLQRGHVVCRQSHVGALRAHREKVGLIRTAGNILRPERLRNSEPHLWMDLNAESPGFLEGRTMGLLAVQGKNLQGSPKAARAEASNIRML